jgi:hypothetical protein
MAKILFTAIAAQMSGKLNGTVFAYNKGGNYARTKTTPLNPRNPAQTNVRSIFSGIASAWRTLTNSQRKLWEDFAKAKPYNDVFGIPRNYSGFQYYMKVNQNLMANGQTGIDEPSDLPAPGVMDLTATAEIDTGVLALTVAGSLTEYVASEDILVIQATPPHSAGRSNVNTMFRTIMNSVASGATPTVNVTSAYTDRFGALVENDTISFRVWVIRKSSGLVGVAATVTATVVDVT